jgi:4-alpha-glucanotransferase
MTVHFFIRFSSKPGQSIAITGDAPELGQSDISKAIPLSYFNHDFWHGVIEINPVHNLRICYKYILKTEASENILEGGTGRVVELGKSGVDSYEVVDTWNFAGEFENAFFTAPFQQVLLKDRESKLKQKADRNFTHIFKVQAPLLEKNQVVCLCGSGPYLKEWNPESPVLLSNEHGWYTAKINLPRENFPLQYKYGVYDLKERKLIGFEAGANRWLQGDAQENKLTIIHDGFVHVPNNTWKGAGVSIPVFSLKTKNSFGIGEFNDLRSLVEWASKTGLKLIQILPVNDTTATHTWTDSYPYSAISAFALHPVYLNLETVAGKKHADLIKPLRKKQKQLNDLPAIDYEQVLKFKLSTVRELFILQKEEFLKSDDFKKFFEENKYWLVPYAAFCYLRDRNGTADFTTWKIYSTYNKEAIDKYVSPKAKHFEHIALQYFIQYHLHLQLKDAAQYAHKNGIILKGDIPIGIYRYSCDAWMEPALYHMDQQAGAPPDGFAVRGQNWGFPTYNWSKMSEDSFEWWHRRFIQMSYYFDAFRIDHILGFFRIWSIPIDSLEGIMGRFVPARTVHVHEFGQRGMWFNYHRLCRPYINDQVLWERFGPNKDKFYAFLESAGGNRYELKEAFNTQRKVEQHFEGLEKDEENGNIRQGLFDLLTDVILFEHPGSNGQEFHFRFAMDTTFSFRHLDQEMQHLLRDLYVDYFYRRQDAFWRHEAMIKLPALRNSTNMLICGEDLGMVPACVPDVMRQLGILSLEIQRMPKGEGREFFHPAEAPYMSVVTPSTHDMSTVRGWWEEDRASTQRFFNNELGQWGEAPMFCEDWINKAIVLQHLYSPAMWSVFQMQDLLGMDENIRRFDPHEERINIPSNPRHYWQFRMHISLEDLIREKEFNNNLKGYIDASGRS